MSILDVFKKEEAAPKSDAPATQEEKKAEVAPAADSRPNPPIPAVPKTSTQVIADLVMRVGALEEAVRVIKVQFRKYG